MNKKNTTNDFTKTTENHYLTDRKIMLLDN